MNYKFFKQDPDPAAARLIHEARIDPPLRPVLGTQMFLPSSRRKWQVVRTIPADNPPDRAVSYYCEEVRPRRFSRRMPL